MAIWLTAGLALRATDLVSRSPKVDSQTGKSVSERNAWLDLGNILDFSALDAQAAALEQNLVAHGAVATSMVSGDFDEDGVPDLVNAYSSPAGGVVTVRHGNLQAIWPARTESAPGSTRSTAATAPFLASPQTFELPENPDFLGTGDFDADGHLDLLAAASGSQTIYWLAGDGHEGFGVAKAVRLPGNLTSLVTGDINRADGLTDVIVGIASTNGPRLLVFEGPTGALNSQPEMIALPAEPSAMVIGQLDDDYTADLAVAAGTELVIIHGRDRCLSLDASKQAQVGPPFIDRISFPFSIASIAIGDFTGSRHTSLALFSTDGVLHLVDRRVEDQSWGKALGDLTVLNRRDVGTSAGSTSHGPLLVRARISGRPADELVVVDSVNRRLHIVMSEMLTRHADDPLFTELQLPREPVVLEVDGEPVAVLPMRLNADARTGLALLRKSSLGPVFVPPPPPIVYTVNSTGDQPDGDLTDGIADTGKAPNLTGITTFRAAMMQANASPGPHTIQFAVPSLSPGFGYFFTGPITIDGTSLGQVELNGDLTLSGGSSVVRSLKGDLFLRFGTNGNNIVEGNTFRNYGGVFAQHSDNNIFGGTTAAARNLVIEQASFGIYGNANQIKGNYIGTDGTTAMGGEPTSLVAVQVAGTNNIIGGTESGAGNVISGWKGTNGVTALGINGGTEGTLVQGNFIGTTASGTEALGNSEFGIGIFGANHSLVGGTTPAARNIVSANRYDGIHEQYEGAGNLIQGNYVGTDITGTKALGNASQTNRFGYGGQGVSIFSGTNNVVGGAVPGAGNLISGNGAGQYDAGVEVTAETTVVQGNMIGTDVTGSKSLGNIRGVLVDSNARSIVIGGASSQARNLISGNRENGVQFGFQSGGNTLGVKLQGNFIGTDITGSKSLANGGDGVFINGSSNIVGGVMTGEGNVIAFNGTNGVGLVAGTGNTIRGNSIFANGGLGVDLERNGVTPNDLKDPDFGANNRQNYPVLTVTNGTVQGTLNSTPNTQFIIDFYSNSERDPSGFGEGEDYISSITASTDSNGNAAFNVPDGENLTATATDPNGNTSEFSAYALGAINKTIQLYQRLALPGSFQSGGINSLRVQFVRNQERIIADAPILLVTSTNVTVRVPVDLIGPSDILMPPKGEDSHVSVRIISNLPQSPVTNIINDFTLIFPRCLLYDEVFVPPTIDERFVVPPGAIAPPPRPPQVPTLLRTLPQFTLRDTNDVATFVFVGRSTDGMAGLRVLNSSLNFTRPLSLDTNILVFGPILPSSTNVPTHTFEAVAPPFQIQNLGFGDGGVQFNVSRDGIYVIVVLEPTHSPGPFPAPFQVHLAGNVGLPRKRFDDDTIEFPRGTRLDTLFNHPAPRPQGLAGYETNVAETALFKFANRVSVSQFALAVLVPPTPAGFPPGASIVRANDPLFIPVPPPLTFVDPTIPTARTTNCLLPALGMVIDFTQVPDPASVWTMPSVAGTVCSVLGLADSLGVTLPLPAAGGATASSLILDMGSGQEIVDGLGSDFKVFALSGSYTVAVGNTPYANTFVPIGGTFSGTQQFDLAGTGLSSARYVRVTAAPTVVLDAVQAWNVFADEVLSQAGQTIGPFIRADRATITLRRAKAPPTGLDPFLQLIAPSGTLFGENESGFGDDLSPDLSDSALANVSLAPEFGFFRFLAKGYDKFPDNQAFGSFFVRLETAGSYDQIKIIVSSSDETGTTAQKTGTISTTRQRDSYLFHAVPGQPISIVVNGKSLGASALPNPMVELYDPEDFLIAANDDFPQRGRNAALSVTLPSSNFAGNPLPNPSTYRLVVSGIDGFASTSPLTIGTAYIRSPAGGGYEVKVFTGALTGTTPVGAPRIDSINPTAAIAGTQVTISGGNFSATTTSNIVLFGSIQATVITASTNQLVVVVPAGVPAGSASVTVRVGGQTSVPANFQITLPATRTAAARLNCFSLRFQPVIVRFAGQDYRLELSSLAGTLPPNGELYPMFDPLDFSHGSGLLLRAVNSVTTIEGFIALDVPAVTDADRDGVADFFQISQSVGSTQTQGDYFTEVDDGTVTATWSRAAGARTGTCRLILQSTTLGQLPAFTNTFEVLEYTGSLTYTPGSNNVTGAVQFTQTQSTSNTLTGPIQFTRSQTNRFNELRFAFGRWTNAINQALIYTNGVIQRVSLNSSNYFGYLGFLDGDLATADQDYYDWVLSIHDPNDVNGNGLPDLSDDPTGSAPVFANPRIEAGQIVLEWQGTGRLQVANEISGSWTEIPGAASPYRQTTSGARRYFRIAP